MIRLRVVVVESSWSCRLHPENGRSADVVRGRRKVGAEAVANADVSQEHGFKAA